MQRPVMNPMYLEEEPAPLTRARRGVWKRLGGLFGRLWRIATFDVLFWRRRNFSVAVEDCSRFQKALRGLTYRLVILPILTLGLLFALVVIATHPKRSSPAADPSTLGLYFEPVSFASGDGVKLDGWLVPLIDERIVLDEREEVLRRKNPAVVLVHDYGYSRSQVCGLLRPLHDAGFVVLALCTRGAGSSGGSAQTFGLKEALDVQAAVELLRRRPYVDETRIAVAGIGCGANAALVASWRDKRIAALVLDSPITDPRELFSAYVGPRQDWLEFMRPWTQWTFQVCYRVDLTDLELAADSRELLRRPLLRLGDGVGLLSHAGQVQSIDFLRRHLAAAQTASAH